MKISKEEINAIKSNLVAIGLVTSCYNTTVMNMEWNTNKNGLRLYATILHLLGVNKLLNGPRMSDLIIYNNTLPSMENLAFSQKFVDYIPLEDEDVKCVLTQRGMEHIIVLFKLNHKGHTRLRTKFSNLIRFGLKG